MTTYDLHTHDSVLTGLSLEDAGSAISLSFATFCPAVVLIEREGSRRLRVAIYTAEFGHDDGVPVWLQGDGPLVPVAQFDLPPAAEHRDHMLEEHLDALTHIHHLSGKEPH